MTEEEKEGIKLIQGDIEDLLNDIENHKDYQNILEKEQIKLRKAVLNLISKLQKENQELKEENIILEGNKIGYKLAIQELEKTIDLIIDDFQAENYFVGMTNKEVREYYKKRKELKE